MRGWILPAVLCLFFFLIPLQCFLIGGGIGAGVQGAVYRFQMTASGESLIPITSEIKYVLNGALGGRTATSVILWAAGALVTAGAAAASLVLMPAMDAKQVKYLVTAAAAGDLLFLGSLMMQYGPLLSGPAGTSIPAGIILYGFALGFLYIYRDTAFGTQ